jgi:hypothetical protein
LVSLNVFLRVLHIVSAGIVYRVRMYSA